MDRLTVFLQQFPVTASVLHAGTLSGNHNFPLGESATHNCGQIHVVRCGQYQLHIADHRSISITDPTIVYIPNSLQHTLQSVGADENREVLCATVQLGDIAHDQITSSLPEVLLLPLTEVAALDTTITLMFSESGSGSWGWQIAQDSLVEYFLVLLLRALIDKNSIDAGILAGLADKRLAKAMLAVQSNLGGDWSLTSMASEAGMSRSRFAEHFKQVIGTTPHQFLTNCRIAAVQQRLSGGENINQFAEELGYSHSTALIRAFQQQTGMTPATWAKQNVHS